jgi:hypothetical protein
VGNQIVNVDGIIFKYMLLKKMAIVCTVFYYLGIVAGLVVFCHLVA